MATKENDVFDWLHFEVDTVGKILKIGAPSSPITRYVSRTYNRVCVSPQRTGLARVGMETITPITRRHGVDLVGL